MSDEKKPKKISIKNLSKKISLQSQSIQNVTKQLSKEKVKLVCKCPHQKNGIYTLKMMDRDSNGNKVNDNLHYICTQCGKEINLSNITQEELNAAIDVFDRAADTIKMLLNLEDKGDEKLYERYSKLQFRMLFDLSNNLAAAKSKGKGKGNKKKNKSLSGGDGWSKPHSR